MEKKPKSRFYLKILLWFVFLSTLGVGGGIFFLLFAVVPIEQVYTDRGWSQFKIDSVMKYFVLGWIVFGFILSFVYYFLVVKKNRWRLSFLMVAASILLCGAGLYYFLNTGTGIVQSSQGEVVEGDRFTFGPYPEKEDLIQLKTKGYDGVITLLSPTLPIEKPLLDQEVRSAEEAGLEVHSLPMLPWVGDNTKSIQQVRKLVQKDDKKYYVHCYLGRHRVDVIKQIVKEETGQDAYEVRFLQPTTLERGSVFYYPDELILMGPYPTDEEWFTRIKRGEVMEVVSLLKDNPASKWPSKEKKIVDELQMTYTSMPMSANPTIQEIRKVAEYAMSPDHKTYVHDFADGPALAMLEAYVDWGNALVGLKPPILQCGSSEWVGRKMLVGCQPDKVERDQLRALGITDFVRMDTLTLSDQYLAVKEAKEQKRFTYLVTTDRNQAVKQLATGLLYGSDTRGVEFKNIKFATGEAIKHERNLLIGPMLEPAEYKTFATNYGVAQIIYLQANSGGSDTKMQEAKKLAEEHHISFTVIPMISNYEDVLIPLLNYENGFNYIMTENSLVPQVNNYLKKF